MKRSLVILGILLAAMGSSRQPSKVDVRAYGAIGDGKTDDTAAFNKAMAVVAPKGGTVSIPVGNYLIKTHLVVPPKVTLEGIWKAPTAWTENEGSTLLAVEGEGSETGPAFITLSANSTLKGITVFYPNQKKNKVAAYPWCIAGAGGDNSTIIDCLLVNPYQGVDFGSKSCNRHLIRNLYAQPLRRGLFVDQCYDIGRIENVHFWPFWSWDGNEYMKEWLWTNGEAFIFARTDWEYVSNTFCFGYKVGYRFTKSATGAMNGNLSGIGADATVVAVQVEQTQGPGLLITNGEFVSFQGKEPIQVVVQPEHSGVVQFQNCAFWGPAQQIARIAGKGYVSFSNCNFQDWSAKTPNTAAITLLGGSLSVVGSNFGKVGQQIDVLKGAESLIFTSNRLVSPLAISNPEKVNAQIGLNIEKKAP